MKCSLDTPSPVSLRAATDWQHQSFSCIFITREGRMVAHLWLNYKKTTKEQHDHFCLESTQQSYLLLVNWIKGQEWEQVKGRHKRPLCSSRLIVSLSDTKAWIASAAVIRGLCLFISLEPFCTIGSSVCARDNRGNCSTLIAPSTL